MPDPAARPIAVYYEHPEWFTPLFAELDRRGVPYVKLDARRHRYDPADGEPPYALMFNRMSPSAFLRGAGRAIFYTSEYLAHLRRLGVRVLNGYEAWQVEISKATQLGLFEHLGVPYPAARVFNDPRQAVSAAEGLRFPVVTKPNVGGSGAGIRRFETREELRGAAEAGEIDLGLDGTALVQEFVPARDRRIVRVEVLDGRLLYAIRVPTSPDSFNLCPADLCADDEGKAAEGAEGAACLANAAGTVEVERHEPPSDVVGTVLGITRAAGIEVGGVEYLVDDRDGRRYFYDVNALSNFVADAPRVVGFDPFVPLVDWLEEERRAAVAPGAGPRPATARRVPAASAG